METDGWHQRGINHFAEVAGGFVIRGVYELNGWWFWYACGRKVIGTGSSRVTVAARKKQGGPWPTKEHAWDELRRQA
jgi:hypothetical protein